MKNIKVLKKGIDVSKVIEQLEQYSDDWYYIVCGCLVGYNAYALHIGAEFQRPTQTFIVMDRDEGKVMCLPIFCADISKETADKELAIAAV